MCSSVGYHKRKVSSGLLCYGSVCTFFFKVNGNVTFTKSGYGHKPGSHMYTEEAVSQSLLWLSCRPQLFSSTQSTTAVLSDEAL